MEKSSANVFYFAIDNVEDFGVKLASALSSSVNCTIKLDTYIQLFRSWLLQPTRKCPETSTEAVQLSLLLLTRAAETMMLWGLPHLILILDNVKVPVFDTNGEYLHML